MAQLRQKQNEFTAITENMSEGFLLLDRQGRILSHNSGALRLLHAAAPEERASYLTLNRTERFRQAVDAALTGRRDEQLVDLGGRCCQLLANPVIQDGQVAGAVLVILDVTEREQREELRREFTANVSHELKTPSPPSPALRRSSRAGWSSRRTSPALQTTSTARPSA